ncbi:MAG: HAMP domain-containing histidine kinase [Planctomyces sp.]|nr:HAMP domain-containing histidine kinase [Planctomyces sp.]
MTRNSLHFQLLWPFAVIQTLAVIGLTASGAWLSIRQSEQESLNRLNAVVGSLQTASFPLHSSVLEQMKGLSGAEFITLSSDYQLIAATMPVSASRRVLEDALVQESALSGSDSQPKEPRSQNERLTELRTLAPIEVNGIRYQMGHVSLHSRDGALLLALIPDREMSKIRQQAMIPLLAGGSLALASLIAVSWYLSDRFCDRIKSLQDQVRRIAGGKFDQELTDAGNDEIRDLADSIRSMASDLQRLTEQIRQNERSEIVTQVAGGLAHHLRNSITGAKLAVQLHEKRFPGEDATSLKVAVRQLSMMESQIQGLLRLTADVYQSPTQGQAAEILGSVIDLVKPECDHKGIQLDLELNSSIGDVRDSEQVQAAFLNLIRNAVHAAGPGGTVQVKSGRISSGETNVCSFVDVSDTGSGLPAELGNRVFEPFVSGTPDGIGLGLPLAAQAARDHGGELRYDRYNGMTRFRFLFQTDLN